MQETDAIVIRVSSMVRNMTDVTSESGLRLVVTSYQACEEIVRMDVRWQIPLNKSCAPAVVICEINYFEQRSVICDTD